MEMPPPVEDRRPSRAKYENQNIVVRLPVKQATAFRELQMKYGGMSKSALLRLAVHRMLEEEDLI